MIENHYIKPNILRRAYRWCRKQQIRLRNLWSKLWRYALFPFAVVALIIGGVLEGFRLGIEAIKELFVYAIIKTGQGETKWTN